MLNLIGCLDKPTSGNYYLEDREVSRFSSGELAQVRGQKIGFIFQTFNLLPRLTALANVELGMTYAGGINRQHAMEALDKVGLADRIQPPPHRAFRWRAAEGGHRPGAGKKPTPVSG